MSTIILFRDVEISLKFSESKSAQVVHYTSDKYCNPFKITIIINHYSHKPAKLSDDSEVSQTTLLLVLFSREPNNDRINHLEAT